MNTPAETWTPPIPNAPLPWLAKNERFKRKTHEILPVGRTRPLTFAEFGTKSVPFVIEICLPYEGPYR